MKKNTCRYSELAISMCCTVPPLMSIAGFFKFPGLDPVGEGSLQKQWKI